MHQLPSGHSYSRQNKLRSQQGEPSQQRTARSAKCICVYARAYMYFFFFFFLSPPTSKQWHDSRESCCQMAPVPLKGKLTLIAPFLQDKRCHPLPLNSGYRKNSDECSFEGSLISPDEDYRIRFPLVPAGGVVTHIGLLLACQCCSDT